MDIKINLSLKNINSSTIGFYNYILQESLNTDSIIGARIILPDANELLIVIEKEFEQLRQPNTLAGLLKILDLTIRNKITPSCILSESMSNLLSNYSKSDDDYLIAVQIVYQVLSSLPKDDPIESELVTKILRGNHESNVKLQTQLALCTVLLIEKFQVDGLLENVWDQILSRKSYCLLVYYIDLMAWRTCIFETMEFWQIIETLLSAENRDDRKLGIYFIRKVLKFVSSNPKVVEIDGFFHWMPEISNQVLTSWLTYLTILENLEEKQSHLILPSLETLDSVTLPEKTPWIRIILGLILKHNNTLVLRWCVNYLFHNFRNLVLDNSILEEFFNATNNTWLYNENLVTTFKLPTLSIGDQNRFLQLFANVSWKSVPMHAWLEQMQAVQWCVADCKLIINIAARLRQLQNRVIRSDCRNMFTSIFASNIKDMVLQDFMNFLDTFFSSTDCLTEELLVVLLQKIEASSQPFISSKVCTILRNQDLSRYESTFLTAFQNIPAKDHQWFSILAVFGFRSLEQRKEFCKRHYNVDINCSNSPSLSLEEAMSENVSKLSWDDAFKAVVRKATVDWYTSRPENITQENYNDLLDAGGITTLINIINPRNMNFPMHTDMLDRLITELKILVKKTVDTKQLISHLVNTCYRDQPKLLYKYTNKLLDIDVTNNQVALNIFQSVLDLGAIDCQEAEGRQLLIRGLLFGEPLSGDLRLEHEYAVRTKLFQRYTYDSTREIRQTCLQFVRTLDSTAITLLKTDLIELSSKMSLKKPRYFENSKHHRLKLRTAQALAVLNQITLAWDEYYLLAILRENNQTNVTYIYEFIAATTISESHLLEQMGNLGNLSTSGQVSMFAISYLFSVFHQSSEVFVEKLITLLLSWTMGANFNTRLHAQITIHHMLQKFKISAFGYLKVAIEESLKESPNALEKLQTDVRYNFPATLHFLDTDPILYVTIVPEDEHQTSYLEYLNKFQSLEAARKLSLTKRECGKEKEEDVLIKPIIEDVQRKMNPELHLSPNHSPSYETCNNDMIIVASLIDKLPNLGGIARTCDVLGMRNLVLDSTKHAQSKEFKNLSMTAENWINISEVKPKALQQFLISKKAEGYHIIGAEQTAKSINFMEFRFPKKSVLLLGHEKEGIPADLIALLDYAVEIPQFGMVRSLNVHVTGALFMYEYCKQHMSAKNLNEIR